MYALCISSNIHKNDEVFTSCCWLLDWQEDGLHIWMIKQMIARYCKSLLESQVVGSKILQLEEKSHVAWQNAAFCLSCSGWWFQTFFIFHNIWDNPSSHWLIFFKMVKTTNQMLVYNWFFPLKPPVGDFPGQEPQRLVIKEAKQHPWLTYLGHPRAMAMSALAPDDTYPAW